jgi:hypothetical protein
MIKNAFDVLLLKLILVSMDLILLGMGVFALLHSFLLELPIMAEAVNALPHWTISRFWTSVLTVQLHRMAQVFLTLKEQLVDA